MLRSLVKSLIRHGELRTTPARAKQAQRLADRLISFGKEGSIHARRRAFRVLQDRILVTQLFRDIAPRFNDVAGGYTRVLRLPHRRGDGALQALLTFSRMPAVTPAAPRPKAAQPPTAPAAPTRPPAKEAEAPKPAKGLFEHLRQLWTRKRKNALE